MEKMVLVKVSGLLSAMAPEFQKVQMEICGHPLELSLA